MNEAFRRIMVAADLGLAPPPLTQRRCGTCKQWRPLPKRDAGMNRHYGNCVAPLPAKIPACFDRALGARWGVAHSAGEDCPAWKSGGKHGDLR